MTKEVKERKKESESLELYPGVCKEDGITFPRVEAAGHVLGWEPPHTSMEFDCGAAT